MREVQRRWNTRTRINRQEKYAPRGACEFCGSTDDLVWDHIDPATKEFNVMSGLLYTSEKIEAEIAKCRVLCRSCNSAGKRNGRHRHGQHVGRTARYRHRDLPLARRLQSDYLAGTEEVPSE